MTITTREELLGVLAELSEMYPNWRLGQLLANVSGWADREIWDADDAQMLAATKTHLVQQASKFRA